MQLLKVAGMFIRVDKFEWVWRASPVFVVVVSCENRTQWQMTGRKTIKRTIKMKTWNCANKCRLWHRSDAEYKKKTTAIHPNIGFLFLFNHLRIQIKYTFLPGCNFKWLHVRYEMIFNVRKSQFQLVFLIEWRQLKVFWFYANETRKFTANCTCSW